MVLAINRYVFLSMLIASVVAWPAPCQSAQTKSMSAAELAFYQGPDREQIILEGAKKEGQVTFYTSNTWIAGPVSKEFEKKYPFVKANVWRSDSKELMKRLTEEVTAARFLADVVETSPEYITILVGNKMLQEYLSPELSAYDDEAKIKGKRGVYAWTSREMRSISAWASTPSSYLQQKRQKRSKIISTPDGKERCRLPEQALEPSGSEPSWRLWAASF